MNGILSLYKSVTVYGFLHLEHIFFYDSNLKAIVTMPHLDLFTRCFLHISVARRFFHVKTYTLLQ